MRTGKGWRNEPLRHSLARKGIKTGRKGYVSNPRTSNIVKQTGSDLFLDKGYGHITVKGNMILWNGKEVDYIENLTPNNTKTLTKDIIDETAETVSEYVMETEPIGTIIYSDNGKEEEPFEVTPYENGLEIDTGETIEFEYKRIDGWRGYYTPKSKDYVSLHEDVILSHHHSELTLKEFDDNVSERLRNNKITYAKVFSRTSNVFSTGYDLMVKKKDKKQASIIIKQVKKEVGL
jgi:hypothetical protein